MSVRVAIVVCSDSRAAGTEADTAGPALADACATEGFAVIEALVVPDDAERIAEVLVRLADEAHADVVLTAGGTGFGPRDVTPEATLAVCAREAPGIAEAIRSGSLDITRRAMLSRAVAALRGTTLVVNLPGSRKGAVEAFGFVAGQLPHAVEMMRGGGH